MRSSPSLSLHTVIYYFSVWMNTYSKNHYYMPQYWLPVYAFATATAHSLARTPAIRIVLKIYFHYSSKHFMFTANRNFNSIRAQQQEHWEKWSSNKRWRRRRHVYEIVEKIKQHTHFKHTNIFRTTSSGYFFSALAHSWDATLPQRQQPQ